MSVTGVPGGPKATEHEFHAVAFAENFSLKELSTALGGPSLPGMGRPIHELQRPVGDGEVFYFPFGVVVFRDVPQVRREAEVGELTRIRTAGGSKLTTEAAESLRVREEPGGTVGMVEGVLVVDRLTPARAGIVALTVAQSAAAEYYERIVESMFERTTEWVDRLERTGTVTLSVNPLHRFIGEAVGTRSEVIAVLHLLDKPDATWNDPAMDAIYDDLRDEFDLVDRHEALEHKLRSVQESLELVLDVARDRRLVLLEASIVALIVLEIVLSFARQH